MVDVDDGDGFPSPEPRTDSRSALPRKKRAWWWLCIVKCDESFSLIFLPEREYLELELRSMDVQGDHEAGGAPHPCGQGVGPLWYFFCSIILINSKNDFCGVTGLLELCRIGL